MSEKTIFQKTYNKILLIIPPADIYDECKDINPIPPLGLAYLGAMLKKEGKCVKILDCLAEGWDIVSPVAENVKKIGLTFETIEEKIKEFSPDIVGVSNHFTSQRKNAREIYKIAKKIDKNIITVAGGAHPTAAPEMEIENEFLDYIILGEGEISFIDLIKYLEGKITEDALGGVCFKENNGFKIIPKRNRVENLDELPLPAYELMNLEKYFGQKYCHGTRKKDRYMPVITSRGCPMKCVFCSAKKVWGQKYRTRTPENVIKELKYLKENYGIEEILFEDDNLTLDIKRAEKIFDLMIEEKLNLVWDTPNGVAAFSLNEKIIKKMKDSGCYSLNLAIESGNQLDLKNIIKKPVDLKKVPRLINYARKIGLEVGVFLVIGIPGQTQKSMQDSFRYCVKLKIYNPFISVATPYPGTELYDICLKNNYISKDLDSDKLGIYKANITTPSFTPEKLVELRNKFCAYLIWQERFHNPLKLIKDVAKKINLKISGRMKQMFYNPPPEAVEIETTTICNRNCRYCPNYTVGRPNELMEETTFYKIIDDLKKRNYTGRISPHFYGEPLTDTRLIKFIEYTKANLPRANIKLFTNGDLLDIEKYLELTKAGVDIFRIAQHSEKPSETIINTIDYIKKYCPNLYNNIEYINYYDMYYNKNNAGEELNNRGGLIDIKIKKRTSCPYVNQITVDYKGNLVLCCNDYNSTTVFGNVNDSDIFDIWYNKSYVNARKMTSMGKWLYDICKKCANNS